MVLSSSSPLHAPRPRTSTVMAMAAASARLPAVTVSCLRRYLLHREPILDVVPTEALLVLQAKRLHVPSHVPRQQLIGRRPLPSVNQRLQTRGRSHDQHQPAHKRASSTRRSHPHCRLPHPAAYGARRATRRPQVVTPQTSLAATIAGFLARGAGRQGPRGTPSRGTTVGRRSSPHAARRHVKGEVVAG